MHDPKLLGGILNRDTNFSSKVWFFGLVIWFYYIQARYQWIDLKLWKFNRMSWCLNPIRNQDTNFPKMYFQVKNHIDLSQFWHIFESRSDLWGNFTRDKCSVLARRGDPFWTNGKVHLLRTWWHWVLSNGFSSFDPIVEKFDEIHINLVIFGNIWRSKKPK